MAAVSEELLQSVDFVENKQREQSVNGVFISQNNQKVPLTAKLVKKFRKRYQNGILKGSLDSCCIL